MSGVNLDEKTVPMDPPPSLEKGVLDDAASKTGAIQVQALSAEFEEITQLKQGLHQRHVQMIALAGTLGTGLFLSSGQAIERAGPLGALLGYSIIGTAAIGSVFAGAEMAALVPLNGGIIRYAQHFVDPALSFANGWNEVYSHIVSVPSEISAAAVIVQFWTDVNSAVFITVFGLLTIATTLVFVRVYGELEYGFSLLKIALVIGLNIMSLVITCGGAPNHEAIGFKYWNHPGPFAQYLGIGGSLGRFLGFWKALNSALYAYSGIENIPLTSAETRNPRTSIPKAAKRVFFKILLFYVITIFFVGLIVPSDNPHLSLTTGNASQSPFVIAAQLAGIKVVPSIINAVVLTSAWSAGNSSLLWGSRILYGMAMEGRAPRFLTRVNRFSIPHYTVLFYAVFMGLAYMSLSSTAANVFDWLKDLVSIATLVNWLVYLIVYLRFYYAFQKQGLSRSRLPWASPLQPYLSWWSLFLLILVLLTGGFSTFIHGHWSTETFISSYINVPIFLALYFSYKFIRKSKIIPLSEIPIGHFLDIAENEEAEEEKKPNKAWRWLTLLWL
ncbi:hypothetical protein HMPREF1624_03804 [Sporothrix schenckii ATCC 58251]|uniref:Amino acid permease/ SLC12A domain-containing protein n=1 Tax=Sporothrix schenckii (strain ATCC 58251 / de Perez 2211183) TaxID=1391915 RepID=U7PXY2_SPOS1|nr:hypothetical protein HMPREF1624_03804 [Sporothrix schenckii ATCC 58251]